MEIVPPIEDRKELIAALARGLVQTIPIAGGLLAESINLWINPLEKRKNEWVNDVSSAINQICLDLSILPETLARDERFFSFLMQSTMVALKNHQDEKLRALRSAIVSSADTARFSEDESFIFLRNVDELTSTHLMLLSALGRHAAAIESATKLEEVFEVVCGSAPSIGRSLFRVCLRDLSSRSLCVFDDLDDFPEYETKREFRVTESSGTRPLTLTDAGQRFLEFITRG